LCNQPQFHTHDETRKQKREQQNKDKKRRRMRKTKTQRRRTKLAGKKNARKTLTKLDKTSVDFFFCKKEGYYSLQNENACNRRKRKKDPKNSQNSKVHGKKKK
jgi:hypothetical protein